MQKKEIITIGGKPGSGKSSTGEKLADLLGYVRFSSGGFMREIAQKRNMSLSEFNAFAQENEEVDHEVDELLKSLRNKEHMIIDSRLGFHWIPDSFKVYLELDLEVAVARIFKDAEANTERQKSGEGAKTIDEVAEQVEQRLASERKRYKELYNIDPYSHKHYDLIIHTSRHSPQTVALAIFDAYKTWLKSDNWNQLVIKIPLKYSLKNDY